MMVIDDRRGAIAPHADVRICIGEIYKLESGLAALGLKAPALAEARDLLTRMSIQIDALPQPPEDAR